jgi:hypothetical protein
MGHPEIEREVNIPTLSRKARQGWGTHAALVRLQELRDCVY